MGNSFHLEPIALSIRVLMAINYPAVCSPIINPLGGNSEKIIIMGENGGFFFTGKI